MWHRPAGSSCASAHGDHSGTQLRRSHRRYSASGSGSDAGGPRVIRDSLRVSPDGLTFTFKVTQSLIRGSIRRGVAITSLSSRGWVDEEIDTVGYEHQEYEHPEVIISLVDRPMNRDRAAHRPRDWPDTSLRQRPGGPAGRVRGRPARQRRRRRRRRDDLPQPSRPHGGRVMTTTSTPQPVPDATTPGSPAIAGRGVHPAQSRRRAFPARRTPRPHGAICQRPGRSRRRRPRLGRGVRLHLQPVEEEGRGAGHGRSGIRRRAAAAQHGYDGGVPDGSAARRWRLLGGRNRAGHMELRFRAGLWGPVRGSLRPRLWHPAVRRGGG